MSGLGSFEELEVDEPYPGVTRRGFDGEGATVTEYRFEPGASFPLHRHPQEQITLIAAGDVEMTIEGRVAQLATGGWAVVGSSVEHGISAGAGGARVIAIVVPRRSRPGEYSVVE